MKLLHLDGPRLAAARDAQAAGDDAPLRALMLERKAAAQAELAEMSPG
jgi:hypothetical protein